MGFATTALSLTIDGVPQNFLTVEEVMERLGFKHRQNVYDAIKRKQLTGFRDDRRMLWISEESVNNYRAPRRGRPPQK